MPVKIPVDRAMFGTQLHTDSTFEGEVRAYEEENEAQGQIVFYGPSNFTRWSKKYGMKPLREQILGKSGAPCVVNRGFGSSCPEHQLYYYSRMIRPLAPSVLVYSPWGNWIDFGYSAEEAWELAERVITWTLTDFEGCRVYLECSHGQRDLPTYGLVSHRRHFDALIRRYADMHENVFAVDAKPYFKDYADGADASIFADHVHFNQKGYDMYADFYRNALKDELAKF